MAQSQRSLLETAQRGGRLVQLAIENEMFTAAQNEARLAAHCAIKFLAVRERGIKRIYGHSIPYSER